VKERLLSEGLAAVRRVPEGVSRATPGQQDKRSCNDNILVDECASLAGTERIPSGGLTSSVGTQKWGFFEKYRGENLYNKSLLARKWV
jgi:hypothetical protein